MDVNISRDEVLMLAYLHEHATGFDKANQFKADALQTTLGRSADEFRRDVTFLAGFGLVGLFQIPFDLDDDEDGPGSILRGIWLTSAGENFMRELEVRAQRELEGRAAQPGTFKRITFAVAGILYDTGKSVVINVLTEFVSGKR